MATDNITVTTNTAISTEAVTNLNGTVVAAEHVQRVAPTLITADGMAVDAPGDATYGQDVDVTRLPALAAGSNLIGKVGITDTYAPVGSHSGGANISTAATLTKPGGANSILIQALTQNVRYTLDATDPTTTLGFQILAGAEARIIAVPGASIKVIQEAATASLQYQWLG